MEAKAVKATSGLKVLAHALVIMNIADHCNRSRYIEPKLNRVLGVLLGNFEGRNLDISNTIEIAYTKNKSGDIEVNKAFLHRRI